MSQALLPVQLVVAGGTIAMHATDSGLAVDPNFPQRLQALLAHSCPKIPLVIHQMQPALDSASATPATWLQLAQWIRAHAEQASAFVVLHGTDTMAYTAAALAQLLAGLGKTVIITGAQKPLGFPASDAEDNLLAALHFAQRASVHDASAAHVALCFGGLLLDGSAARKQHSQAWMAFDSPNHSRWAVRDAAGMWQCAESWQSALVLEQPSRFLQGQMLDFPKQSVAQLLLSPDMPEVAFAPVLASESVQAVVVQSYGMGNLPNHAALEQALLQAQARGVVLVNVSQCWGGGVAQSTYAAGAGRLGLLSAGMHTPEAVYTVLSIGLAYGLRGTALRTWVQARLATPATE